LRRQRLPGVVRLTRQRVLIGQQGDAGGPLGQHRVLRGARGIQIVSRRLRQQPALQREFAGQAGFQRIHPGLRCSRIAGYHHGAGQQRGQQRNQWERARTGALRIGHGKGRYNWRSGPQLSAGN